MPAELELEGRDLLPAEPPADCLQQGALLGSDDA